MIESNEKYCIIGCDIRSYSKIENIDQKTFLNIHLKKAHKNALEKVVYDNDPVKGLNDTGDGFFVLFKVAGKNNITEIFKYIEFLSIYYYKISDEEKEDYQKLFHNKEFNKTITNHWLKLAWGFSDKADLHIFNGKTIIGLQVDKVARILEVAKLPILLIIPDNYIKVCENEESFAKLTYSDKHNDEVTFFPYFLNIKTNIPDIDKYFYKDICKDGLHNPLFLLKNPGFPYLYGKLKDDWSFINNYIHYWDNINSIDHSKRAILQTIYLFGHSMKKLYLCLAEIAKFFKDRVEDIPEIRIIFLDPLSEFALNNLDDEDDIMLTEKIIIALEKVNNVLSDNPHIKNKVDIKFSSQPISIGCHKILDYMFIINYGDDFRGRISNYEILNYYSKKDEDKFNNYKKYFDSLWDENETQFKKVIITKIINGNQLSSFLQKCKQVRSISNINNTITHHDGKSLDYYNLFPIEFRNTLLIRPNNLTQSQYIRQIEFHPSKNCTNNCVFCIGQGIEDIGKNEITIDDYIPLFEEIVTRKITQVIISGQYSEPLLYGPIDSFINELVQRNIRIGLYTNGLVSFDKKIDSLFGDKFDNNFYITLNIPANPEESV